MGVHILQVYGHEIKKTIKEGIWGAYMSLRFLLGMRNRTYLVVSTMLDSIFELTINRKNIKKNIIKGLEGRADKKILIIDTLNLGDLMVTTPIYSKLKSSFPNIKIDLLIKKSTSDVFKNNPNISRIWHYDENNLSRLLSSIRKERYFLAMDLFNNYLNLKRYFIAFRSGARYRMGFENDFYKGFLNHLNVFWKLDAYNETINYYKILTALMKIESPPERLELYFSEDEKKSAGAILRKNGINKKYVVMHPCSQNPRKLWSVEKFAELAEKMAKLGFQVVLTGSGRNEVGYAGRIKNKIKPKIATKVIDLTGRITLRQWFFAISKASLLISIDTSAIHVAAATSTPTVALFGPTNRNVWSPYNKKNQIVVTGGNCTSCEKRFIFKERCRFDEIRCMASIRVDDAYRNAKRAIKLGR